VQASAIEADVIPRRRVKLGECAAADVRRSGGRRREGDELLARGTRAGREREQKQSAQAHHRPSVPRPTVRNRPRGGPALKWRTGTSVGVELPWLAPGRSRLKSEA